MRRTFIRSVAAALVGGAVLAACNASAPVREGDGEASLLQGYTCCNLHYTDDWISDGNYAEGQMIPAGTPVRVTGYGRHRAYVELDGKSMRLGHDYGREQESTEQWVAKVVVKDDPKARIAGYPAAVREAIAAGRVMRGMTKEQVLVSLGYPLTSENRSLDAPLWRYWYSSFSEYQVLWNADGRVKEIATDPLTRNLVEYKVR